MLICQKLSSLSWIHFWLIDCHLQHGDISCYEAHRLTNIHDNDRYNIECKTTERCKDCSVISNSAIKKCYNRIIECGRFESKYKMEWVRGDRSLTVGVVELITGTVISFPYSVSTFTRVLIFIRDH